MVCNCNCCDHGRNQESGRLWLSSEEKEQIARRLEQRPDQSMMAYKPGKGGDKPYLPGNVVFEMANSLFGFNGWSSSVLKLEPDYCTEKNGRWWVGVTAYVRISLKDGTYHEEVGYGSAENLPSRTDAVKKSQKEAVTDAKKRALRLFGNAIGLCIADKDFVSAVKRGRGELYQGAVETVMKKKKQQEDTAQAQALNAKLQSSEPVNHDKQTSAQTLQPTKAGTSATNTLNPMPVGPVPSRNSNQQQAVMQSHQRNNQQAAMKNLQSKNQHGMIQSHQNSNSNGVMQNQQNNNQKGVMQHHQNNHQQGVMQNHQNNNMQAAMATLQSNNQQGVVQNQQRPASIELRSSPTNGQPQVNNQFQRHSSMPHNLMPPNQVAQPPGQAQYTGAGLNHRQQIGPPQPNNLQNANAAPSVQRPESFIAARTSIIPNNLGQNVNNHQRPVAPDVPPASTSIYDFQDLDDLCPGDYQAPR